jgi:murein DD-endopeptidase MepM/ murein hydrolase activator NlpD
LHAEHSGSHRQRLPMSGSRGQSRVRGRAVTQARRTGVATAVVSTLGIAMVNTTGIAYSQPPADYGAQASITGLGSAPSSTGATDSLSDPNVMDAHPLTAAQIAYEREQADDVDRDTALADLMVTLQQRRVSTVLAEAAQREAARWVRPDVGYLSQGFGGANGHPGIDLAGPYGSDVLAAHSGTVIYAGWESGYGNFIQIMHDGNIVTCYGHLSRILVRVGEQVKTGETIGLEGSTGDSTGPHLHFEVRLGGQNGTKVNPLTWLAAHGIAV